MITLLGLFSCLKLHLVKQTLGSKKALLYIDAVLRATTGLISVLLLRGCVLAQSCNESFCFEWYVCSASQFLLLILWWKVALLYDSRPTHHTTSPAEPREPNLLLRSPGTEMERSWRLQFIPRYSQSRSVPSIIIQSLPPTRYYKM